MSERALRPGSWVVSTNPAHAQRPGQVIEVGAGSGYSVKVRFDGPAWFSPHFAMFRAEELRDVTCTGCRGPAHAEGRVYFGVVGPFCSVACREKHLKIEDPDALDAKLLEEPKE